MIPPVYTDDAHGNMTKMPNTSNMIWDYKDQLISAANGSTFTSYYSYDDEGNRTRKVVVKGNIREERYYIGDYEVYRKYTGTTLNLERKTVNISDDEKVFVRIETETGQNPVIRYQYDNHLGSACLELDTAGLIISYEEYHPFGTTSYRSGRNSTEVSLKRYKYCGKERDEETGLYYYGARYYASWLCRFVSCDPLQHEQPDKTPYHYCSNNPVKYIDPTGMFAEDFETKYFNHKGELLYETNDGLNDVIIVKDADIPKLKSELQTASNNGTINDPKTNQQKMHMLGQTPQQYTNEATKGMDDYWVHGYKETYEKTYKEGKGVFRDNFSLSQLTSALVAAIATENEDNSGQERHSGRVSGIQDGNYDRKNGFINRLNPSSSLKNNSPLIKLMKLNINNGEINFPYPGVGLPPK